MGAGLAGAAADYFGGKSANNANAQQAKDQMAFQERMSNTSYQRAVADMRAAGLNPALAYQQGGASTPSGAQAHMENASARIGGTVTNALATAMQAKQIQAGIDNTKADTIQKLANAKVATATIDAEIARRGAVSTTALAEARNADDYFGARSAREGLHAGMDELNKQFLRETYATRLKLMENENRQGAANAKSAELILPGLRNRAEFEDSTLGRYYQTHIGPFLNGAQTAANAGNSAAAMGLKLNSLRYLIP